MNDLNRLNPIERRQFLKNMSLGGALALSSPSSLVGQQSSLVGEKSDYSGPNVIIIRFGGGVRRKETIDPEHTYSPFFCHELVKKGTLFKRMEITSIPQGAEARHETP